MKNEKGFTLVEVMAVMIIMMIIMIMAFPNFTEMTKSAKGSYDINTQKFIKNAARMYVNNNIDEFTNNGTYDLPVGKLIAYEYLDSDIKNYSGNNPISDNTIVVVTRGLENGKTKFTYAIDTTRTATGDYYPPVLTLKKGTEVVNPDTVTATTLQEYESMYTVVANETLNSDGIKKVITRGYSEKILLIEYTATDTSGNKAIPLKVKLTIE